MKRHLRAIMVADIVGYSRLMEADEDGTIARLNGLLSDTVRPAITRHNGRIVKLLGDGVLAVFTSAVDAVRCAVEVQTAMQNAQTGQTESERMRYRIGINLGDIVEDGDDVLGDGVNIAARLEQRADPGGICISGTVYDHLKQNVQAGYRSLGKLRVKNIQKPVQAYAVLLDGSPRAPWRWDLRSRPAQLGAAALAIVLIGAIVFDKVGAIDKTSALAGLPKQPLDLPAIVVLPFDNPSGNVEQDYFSDGITVDLITDLGQVSGLLVLARNTSFAFKDSAAEPQQIARELGVQYLLEGSVRRQDDRVRINAQLVDGTTGAQVWADRYDREMTDLFALQDDVVRRIVAALAITLAPDEQSRLTRTEKIDAGAYDALLRGLERMRRFTPETILEARQHFEQAIKLDPNFARAWVGLGLSYAIEAEALGTKDPLTAATRGLEYSERALALDPNLPQVHFALSLAYNLLGRLEASMAASYRAIELDPNYADGYGALAVALNYLGRPEEGLEAIRRAIRLNPLKPFNYTYIEGQSHYLMGNYETTVELLETALAGNPQFTPGQKLLAATYVELGQIEDAEWAAQEYLATAPGYSLENEISMSPFADAAVKDRYIDALRRAGIN